MQDVPASGKSFYAELIKSGLERNGYTKVVITSADDFFLDINGQCVFNQALLSKAHNECYFQTETALLNGNSFVIVDNTNMKSGWVHRYKQLARKLNVDLQVVHTYTIPEVCKRRNNERQYGKALSETVMNKFISMTSDNLTL